jgi:hypothetical protein
VEKRRGEDDFAFVFVHLCECEKWGWMLDIGAGRMLKRGRS